jgi:hypothetical protein
MTKREYALEPGGPKALKLQWGLGMRDFQVSFGDASWRIDEATLESGARLVLPSGSMLLVQRPKHRWHSFDSRSYLVIERDGIPVPGSDGDPHVVGRRAGRVILFFGVVRTGIAGVAAYVQDAGDALRGAAPILLAGGGVLIVLGVLAMFAKRLPVAIATGLFALEFLSSFVVGSGPNPMGIPIQIAVIWHLSQAWRRMAPRQVQPSLASVFE